MGKTAKTREIGIITSNRGPELVNAKMSIHTSEETINNKTSLHFFMFNVISGD
jgi:hypothetical protein